MRSTFTPVDTDRAAFLRQVERWRSMTPVERAELADILSVDVTAIAVAGIRFNMPGACLGAVRHELARRRYGRRAADAGYDVDPPA